MCVVATCMAVFAVFAAPTAIAQTSQAAGERTTLYVTVAVERWEVVAGPYARYAQKYLGVTAPLADKVSHEIKSVNLSDISELAREDEATIVPSDVSHMSPRDGFPRLTVDRTSAAALSLEESARLAADKIFAIRKSRLDLITGEVGENVFGGGLGSALTELGRLEEEYLSLFLGKQTTRIERKQYSVTPVKGRLTYTVLRFSESDGLLPEDDMSGVPVVLELKPADGSQVENAATQSKPNARAVPHFVPADMRCRIILDGVELTSELFSIRQLGQTVYLMP